MKCAVMLRPSVGPQAWAIIECPMLGSDPAPFFATTGNGLTYYDFIAWCYGRPVYRQRADARPSREGGQMGRIDIGRPALCVDCEHERVPAKCHSEITLSEMEEIQNVAAVKERRRIVAWLRRSNAAEAIADAIERCEYLGEENTRPNAPRFYVKHRTAQEMSGSGHRPPDMPWQYDGPFTREEADAHWAKIHPDWQEGGVVTKCEPCGQWRPV